MHGNLLNKNKNKMFLTANSDLAARISILENNVYKVTYYEIISGATGTLTVPTAATINANEFSGANCILSEIDVNNKPTWVSPKDAGGTVVTASLNTGTGAWVKSGVTVSANVALIYSLNIRAADYANLTNFYIVEETVIGDFSYVLNNTTIGTVTSTLLANAMSDETGSGSLVFGTSPTFTTDITTPKIYTNNTTFASQTGIIYKGGSKFIHNFNYGNNGTVTTDGNNTFIGINAGNFTMGSTATVTYQASSNTAVGYQALMGNTIGYSNCAFGTNALVGNTSGNTNLAFGNNALYSNSSGGANCAFGHAALFGNTTGNGNQAIGYAALYNLTSGGSNIAIGQNAGRYISGGVTANLTCATSIFIGNNSYPLADSQDNQIVIGYALVGAGTNTVSIGNSTVTDNYFNGMLRTTVGTGSIKMGNLSGSTTNVAFYFNQSSLSATNYAISSDGNGLVFNAPAGNITLRSYNSLIATFATSAFTLSPVSASSGITQPFTFTVPVNTGQTASTEIPNFKVTGNTKTWANGGGATTIAAQRWNHFTANTAATSGGGSLTITNSYGAYFEAATASGVTITNNWALGTDSSINVVNGGYAIANSLALNSSSSYVQLGANSAWVGVKLYALGTARFQMDGGTTSGATSYLTCTPSSNTGQTASTEINGYLYNSYSRTWANGGGATTIATQRERWKKTVTYATSGGGSLTITDAFTEYIESATASGVTITNNWALGLNGAQSTLIPATGTAAVFGVTGSSNGKLTLTPNTASNLFTMSSSGNLTLAAASSAVIRLQVSSTISLSLTDTTATFADALNFVFNTTTGTKLGTATTQKLSFWNATPIVQPTTAGAAATFVANTSGIVNDTATFDGYTIGQVVKALRNCGLLA